MLRNIFIFLLGLLAATPAYSELSVSERGQRLVAHVRQSLENTERGISKLNTEILGIEGMSSAKVRHLLNNLCSLPDANYLEIGCWKGSTWVSALYGNGDTMSSAIGIDDWSEFEGPAADFRSNCAKFLPNSRYNFYSDDCFTIDLKTVFQKPVNIYFYDGGHTTQFQEMAFTYFNSILDDVFIAVVDDWNFVAEAQQGTYNAFRQFGYHLLFEKEFLTSRNGDTDSWWNGLYVVVVQKQR